VSASAPIPPIFDAVARNVYITWKHRQDWHERDRELQCNSKGESVASYEREHDVMSLSGSHPFRLAAKAFAFYTAAGRPPRTVRSLMPRFGLPPGGSWYLRRAFLNEKRECVGCKRCLPCSPGAHLSGDG
jgi:hypothetical protein